MIILESVTKVVGAGAKKREVLTAVRARLPTDRRIAVLGLVPEDKKMLIDLLGGVKMPTAGRIIRKARVGFPAGHVGGFTVELSVHLNVAHVARLYGADVETVARFVAEAADLGGSFNNSYKELPNVKRRHLSDILAFSIPFDVYLLSDDLVRPGGARYSKAASALFKARAETSGMIIAVDDVAFAREFCDMGLVLSEGQIRLFKNIERAISFYQSIPVSTPREEKRKARLLARKKKTRRLL